jgi:protein-disulfide isomerase
MKRFLPLSLAVLTLALAACVDTTGLSPTSSRTPNPKTNANASVVVTEYGDLQCPACKGAYTLLVGPLIEKYGMRIRFEFKHFPLQTVHQYAMLAAEASECAADQGKFWEFVDMNYLHQEDLSRDRPAVWAKDLGLDADLFDRCAKSHIKRKEILADYDEGVAKGVQGTPTFFVNGEQVNSTMEDLSAAIDAQLAKTQQQL